MGDVYGESNEGCKRKYWKVILHREPEKKKDG